MFLRLSTLYELNHGGRETVSAMEGLRGFAVFLVFLVHFATLVDPWVENLQLLSRTILAVRELGNVGVDLFFVLSGYLIYGSLVTKVQRFRPFLRRRIERLYPTFTVVFLLYLALSVVFPHESKLPGVGWESIRYISANFLLLPGIFAIDPMITVAWSLSYEMLFYLTIPVLVALLRLRNWPWQWRAGLISGCCILIWLYPPMFGGHVRFIMFGAGMLLFELGRLSWRRYADIIGLAALVFIVTSVRIFAALEIEGPLRYLILGIAFVLLGLPCFCVDGSCRTLFSWTPIRWLGNISYSFYLIHGLAAKFFFLVLSILFPPHGGSAWVVWVSLPTSFALAFFVSTLLFLAVEKPLSLTAQPHRRRFLGSAKAAT